MVMERARVWPLEERVSSLPAMPRATAVRGGAAALKEVPPEGQRGRTLQLGAIAAGLLLAIVGIYGSLRSASAGAEKESPKASVAGAGDAGSRGTAAIPAVAPSGAVAKDSAVGRDVAAVPSVATPAVPTARVPAAKIVTAGRSPVTVAKATGGPAGGRAARPVVVPEAPEVVAKDRQDDAAVEAKLARGQKGGKFLFVPAEVMEKHLVSSRTPIVPPGAAGQGRVVLNAFIAKDGTVSRTDVVEGPAKLINSAVAAVSWRKYRPFLVGGKAAEVVTPVTVSYAGR